MRKWRLWCLRLFYIGLLVALPIAAVANYPATPGLGLTFGSVIIGGVHFASQLICDFTTANQCAAVKAASTSAAATDPSLVVQNAQEHTDLAAINTSVQASIPAGTAIIGFTSNDVCSQKAKLNFAIATSAGNLQLVAGVSAQKVYICSIALIAAATAVTNIIEGTGAACTTANEAAIIGSTTAASGMAMAANTQLTLGNGGATVGVTATAANGICLLQSGTAALAGNITYVQQ